MYLCRDILGTPLKQIGEILDGRDHTTIMHGQEKIADEIQKNDSVRQLIDTIKKKIDPN